MVTLFHTETTGKKGEGSPENGFDPFFLCPTPSQITVCYYSKFKIGNKFWHVSPDIKKHEVQPKMIWDWMKWIIISYFFQFVTYFLPFLSWFTTIQNCLLVSGEKETIYINWGQKLEQEYYKIFHKNLLKICGNHYNFVLKFHVFIQIKNLGH